LGIIYIEDAESELWLQYVMDHLSNIRPINVTSVKVLIKLISVQLGVLWNISGLSEVSRCPDKGHVISKYSAFQILYERSINALGFGKFYI